MSTLCVGATELVLAWRAVDWCILVGWRNLGCLLKSVGVKCGRRNLGIAGLRRCIVHVNWFSCGSRGFDRLCRVMLE